MSVVVKRKTVRGVAFSEQELKLERAVDNGQFKKSRPRRCSGAYSAFVVTKV